MPKTNFFYLLGHSSSTFCLETNPSTSLRMSPKVQADFDAVQSLCWTFLRPKSAFRNWTHSNTFSRAASKAEWVVSVEDPMPSR